MAKFARDTAVPVERSRAEIEGLLARYGATEFVSGWRPGEAMVGFRMQDLYVRFTLPLPDKHDRAFTHKPGRTRHSPSVQRTPLQTDLAWEQEVRRRWRALALVVKAKLEAVDSRISTLEREFLAFVVLPDQTTLGDWITDHALKNIKAGRMPLALPPHEEPATDADLELTG